MKTGLKVISEPRKLNNPEQENKIIVGSAQSVLKFWKHNNKLKNAVPTLHYFYL